MTAERADPGITGPPQGAPVAPPVAPPVRRTAGPAVTEELPAGRARQRVVKRTFDVVLAALLLVCLAPVLLVLACLVGVTSRGPVLFRQVRIGHRGRRIVIYKFRSMVVDAEHRLDEVRALDKSPRGPLFKVPDDPRVTRLGRFLRRFSLDELPQLLNVLGGSMSLVGPRPALPVEVDHYDAEACRRLLAKPGLTGLWQVSGRSDLDWRESMRLDLQYVEQATFALDLVILARTIPAVLSGRGAY